MEKYNVTVEVFRKDVDVVGTHGEQVKVEVEAGNKKLAVLRAMSELNKSKEYSNCYERLVSVEKI